MRSSIGTTAPLRSMYLGNRANDADERRGVRASAFVEVAARAVQVAADVGRQAVARVREQSQGRDRPRPRTDRPACCRRRAAATCPDSTRGSRRAGRRSPSNRCGWPLPASCSRRGAAHAIAATDGRMHAIVDRSRCVGARRCRDLTSGDAFAARRERCRTSARSALARR